MLTPDEIERLRALYLAATPGRWRWIDEVLRGFRVLGITSKQGPDDGEWVLEGAECIDPDDRDYIIAACAACAAVQKLLDEIERLRGELEKK